MVGPEYALDVGINVSISTTDSCPPSRIPFPRNVLGRVLQFGVFDYLVKLEMCQRSANYSSLANSVTLQVKKNDYLCKWLEKIKLRMHVFSAFI